MTGLLLILVGAATTIDALLMGAGLDYTIKQLPARKIIGIIAYRKYFLASDLANGRFWYIPLGLTGYVLNPIVAILAYSQNGVDSSTILFSIAATFSLVHAFGTSQAVPAGLRFRGLRDENEANLSHSFEGFARWVIFRGIVGAPMFGAMLLGLVALS